MFESKFGIKTVNVFKTLSTITVYILAGSCDVNIVSKWLAIFPSTTTLKTNMNKSFQPSPTKDSHRFSFIKVLNKIKSTGCQRNNHVYII